MRYEYKDFILAKNKVVYSTFWNAEIRQVINVGIAHPNSSRSA